MSQFEMVKYHSQDYPADIPLKTEEIAAHFDISSIGGSLNRSLHTEYSYGKRKFCATPVTAFDEIVSAHKDGVPQLWKSQLWAEQFAHFVIGLVGNSGAPEVIEIHPPFNDYTDMNGFISSYRIFEEQILSAFPQVKILIENRCGSVYHGGRFLISKMNDIEELCEQIERNYLQLMVAYDVPQIYTAHNAASEEQYCSLLDKAAELRNHIGGVHLWGKKKSPTGRKVSHCGDLNTYFENNEHIKK